jgi:hypothetical protein
VSFLDLQLIRLCKMFSRYNIKKNPAYKEAFASNTEVVAADE